MQDHWGQKEEVESPEYKALLGLLLPALPLTLNFLSSVNATLTYKQYVNTADTEFWGQETINIPLDLFSDL